MTDMEDNYHIYPIARWL